MCGTEKLLIFTLSDLRCGLRLSDIERILSAVAISPLPKAPDIVMGLINVHGRIVPVLDIRSLLRLPEMEMTLNDQIIIARTTSHPVAILVDKVQGIAELSDRDIVASEELYPGIEYLQGVTKLKEGILFIYNLDGFLSSEEKAEIEHLLTGGISMPADRET